MRPSRLAALALAAAAATVLAAGAARADGDPASDYLISQQLFLPADARVPQSVGEELASTIAEANRKGFRVRVAMIGTTFDLGAVQVLWKHPQPYAKFLGQELFSLWDGALLIVMPNGYGFYDHGRDITAARGALDRLAPAGSAGTPLAAAAARALQALAAQRGVRLAAPSVHASGGGLSTRVELIVIVAGVVALGAAAALARALWRRRRGDLAR